MTIYHDFFIEFKDIIVPLIVSFLSAGFALCGVFLSNYNQRKLAVIKMEGEFRNEKERFIREKIEKFHHLFSLWENSVSSALIKSMPYYIIDLDEKDMFTTITSDVVPVSGDPKMVTTMLNIYFPSLISLYKDVDEARANLMKFYLPRGVDKNSYAGFKDAQMKFENKCNEFKDEIAKLSVAKL